MKVHQNGNNQNETEQHGHLNLKHIEMGMQTVIKNTISSESIDEAIDNTVKSVTDLLWKTYIA